jgi:hypothetical protein
MAAFLHEGEVSMPDVEVLQKQIELEQQKQRTLELQNKNLELQLAHKDQDLKIQERKGRLALIRGGLAAVAAAVLGIPHIPFVDPNIVEGVVGALEAST